MKSNPTGFSRQYHAALRKHLKRQNNKTSLSKAASLGRRAMTIGIETLDLARIHEKASADLVLPNDSRTSRNMLSRRAGIFFAEVITPIEKSRRTARAADHHLDQMIRTLNLRGLELVAARRQLKQEISDRELLEQSLKRSEEHSSRVLKQSQLMHEELRLLSRQLLLVQEEERKKISRELHDVIAQTLTSINVQLATLKKDAIVDTHDLERNITRTQRMVEKSVDVVHRFARELRPPVLDDLGLIPALLTFMKSFKARTGIQVSLSAFAAVEQVNGHKRTVLYRVAQEALANVARHSEATAAEVKIQRRNGVIHLEIKDNGKGFQTDRLSVAAKIKRLGLLGMRERLEMVGGSFTVISAPGKGTTVVGRIPAATT